MNYIYNCTETIKFLKKKNCSIRIGSIDKIYSSKKKPTLV